MLKTLVLLAAINAGAWLGWLCGSPGGLMTAYLSGVVGASTGLFIGRRIQRQLG